MFSRFRAARPATTQPGPDAAAQLEAAVVTALATPADLWTEADREAVRLAHRRAAAAPRPVWACELTDAQLARGARTGMLVAAAAAGAVLVAGALLPAGWATGAFVLVTAPLTLGVAGALRHVAAERRWRTLDTMAGATGLLPDRDGHRDGHRDRHGDSAAAVKFPHGRADNSTVVEPIHAGRDDAPADDGLPDDPIFALAPAEAIARAQALTRRQPHSTQPALAPATAALD